MARNNANGKQVKLLTNGIPRRESDTLPETPNGHGSLARVAIIIPAYNEERFIGSVVLKALEHGMRVLVVDDGSTDATAEVARRAGAKVIRHQQNRGKGAALNTAFIAARELGADAVVVLDGDGQHLPEELNLVLAPVLSGEADIVVGSRYLERHSDVPSHRVIGHRVFNMLTNRSSGLAVTDSQSGFRAFSKRALYTLSFHSNGFSVESEMQFLARDNGLKLVEVPITIRYQDKPKRNVVVHGLMVLNGMLHLIGQHRPLLFLGVPGAVGIILGVLWGLWVVELYRTSQTLAVGYALIDILLLLASLLALSTGITLHSIRGLVLNLLQPQDMQTPLADDLSTQSPMPPKRKGTTTRQETPYDQPETSNAA